MRSSLHAQSYRFGLLAQRSSWSVAKGLSARSVFGARCLTTGGASLAGRGMNYRQLATRKTWGYHHNAFARPAVAVPHGYRSFATEEPKKSEEEQKKEGLFRDTPQGRFTAVGVHKEPTCLSDRIALMCVKALRIPADFFFRKKYIHRAVVLETVAGVPGMVAGMVRHLRSLRRMQHDGGWIHELLDEAENERMHLLTFIKISQPSWLERMLVVSVQGVFFNLYFLAYLFFPRTAHRFVGYLEEEAVISYTQFLKEIDEGRIENIPAPQIAINYWKMKSDARLRDLVLEVRLDEAMHRDVNHRLSDKLIPQDLHPHVHRTESALPPNGPVNN